MSKSKKPKMVLKRLEIGERIKIGDWCCDHREWKDGRVCQPVKVVEINEYSIISKTHHPHYRIIEQFSCKECFYWDKKCTNTNWDSYPNAHHSPCNGRGFIKRKKRYKK